MSDFAINLGIQGYSPQHNVENQLGTANAKNQVTGGINLYNEFTIWQAATQTAVEETALLYMEQGLFDDFDEALGEAKSFAEDFSLNQEGKTYGEQMETLSQQHLEAYDTDEEDGKISFKEFVQKEVNEYNAIFGDIDGEISSDDAMVQALFQNTFDFMDLNDDESIDVNEIKAYYITADIFDTADNLPGNIDETMDGTIKFSAVEKISDMMSMTPAPYTREDEEKATLKCVMEEIYQTALQGVTPDGEGNEPEKPEGGDKDKTDEIPEAPVFSIECGEPTPEGKAIMMIEKNLFISNPFEE